jgi:hypothetical protein
MPVVGIVSFHETTPCPRDFLPGLQCISATGFTMPVHQFSLDGRRFSSNVQALDCCRIKNSAFAAMSRGSRKTFIGPLRQHRARARRVDDTVDDQ